MSRGFLLSLDALFALSIILLGLSFFAFRPSFESSGGAALFLGGRDFLASGGAIEPDLLRRGWSVSGAPIPQAALTVRADRFTYPKVCGLATAPAAPCLNVSDASIQSSAQAVWVGSG